MLVPPPDPLHPQTQFVPDWETMVGMPAVQRPRVGTGPDGTRVATPQIPLMTSEMVALGVAQAEYPP